MWMILLMLSVAAGLILGWQFMGNVDTYLDENCDAKEQEKE